MCLRPDLALWLVFRYAGPDLRQLTAHTLVLEGRGTSQAPYVAAVLLETGHTAMVESARRWLARNLERNWTVDALARHCHTTPRTLLRHFRLAVGQSPSQHVQQLRVERAKSLLEATRLSLEQITGRCGYGDAATLSRVFKRWTSLTPREYRIRFGLRA